MGISSIDTLYILMKYACQERGCYNLNQVEGVSSTRAGTPAMVT